MTRISLSAGRECLNFTFDRRPDALYTYTNMLTFRPRSLTRWPTARSPTHGGRLPGKDAKGGRLPAHGARLPGKDAKDAKGTQDARLPGKDARSPVNDAKDGQGAQDAPKDAQEGPRMGPGSTIVGSSGC